MEMTLRSRSLERSWGLQITTTTSSGRKSALKVSTYLATAGAEQSFCSVLKEATHRLQRTITHQTISPDGDTQSTTNHRPLPWRSAPPRTCHVATPTTGIAAPNLVLSELCRRPMSNTAIPTARATAPLCRGPHRSRPCHQTPETLPCHCLGTCCF
jgi:hypothetical protein